MDTIRVCPECGTPMPANSPEGLCPKCLMKAGIGSATAQPGQPPGREPPAPLPPEEIAKFFPQLQVLELLGQGGMGTVYKARQPQLDRFVALKILSPELSRDPAFAERFAREAKALARLNHPNIVGVYDFGQAGEFYYFIMEYVDGMNLWHMEQVKKPLAPEEALAIVPKICDALQYAHEEGIVHRDIKPGNILMDKKGRVKIADFGLAKLVGQQAQDFRLTQSRMMLGTPQYMAPEQIEDPQKVDHRADIYSLGVVFYEMLTGELPMGRFALPSEKVRVDVRLDEVVLRTLAKEPERRYQHASDVRTAVESVSGPTEKLPPHLRRQVSGYEYKSKRTLWGLPVIHIASGMDPDTGKQRTAKGIIAIGPSATGVFASGGSAKGVFAVGGFSVGLVAVGGCALGLVGVGGLAIGLLLACGGLALAPIAVGYTAIGYHAYGGTAWGVRSHGSNTQASTTQVTTQRILAEFDWQKLADEGRLLGGVLTKVDGRTVLKIENTNSAPYALSGEMKYENVEGEGFLEMWNCFPPSAPGQPEMKAFSRTLETFGPLGKIMGTSNWREVSLPFNRTGAPSAPTRLEVNIFLPGRGVVFLGPLKLSQF
ncbi:MAG: hypothetical protein DME25_14570 [Verrucomicrobia bacterium]|nr:MAG: hypothetical protein DME25_14570 [Verrucomicrobiota bacterium]